MIRGHGDDTWQYEDIQTNFSSNIYGHADMSALKQFLCQRISVIDAYPEPQPSSLERAIAQQRGVPMECVLATSGATEAIYLVAQMLSKQGFTHYYAQQPTFSEYADASQLCHLLPTKRVQPGTVVWLCTPNNPTGQVVDFQSFAAQLVQSPARGLRQADETAPQSSQRAPLGKEPVFVLDQSYEDYTLEPVMQPAEALERHETLILIYSLTKTYAVPGLRIGYVVAPPQIIALLRALTHPWAVNALAIEAGKWLLGHNVKAVDNKTAYMAEAQRLNRMLGRLQGVEVLPTQTNFMLARLEQHTAAQLKHHLATKHHVLIRDASNFVGLNKHYFRVSAQLPAENDRLVELIGDFLRLPATGGQTQ